MQSWMTSNNPDFLSNTSVFCSNGGFRKRKLAESDFEDKSKHKMFSTDEKLITNMQTLSLDLSVNNNNKTLISQKDEDKKNETNNSSLQETKFELHKLLKDNLRKDDLQDGLINKLCDFERRKLSMQIVPYMPIHPTQLNNNNNNHSTLDEKEQENQNKIPPPIKVKENDDHLFKKPFAPTPYTVEEPCENTIKRTPTMKRSYSQSMRSNSNLSVIELKNDSNDSSIGHSQSDYFIYEPSTPSLLESSTNRVNSSYLLNQPSIRITEYFDFSPSNNNDNDIDMQSVILSDYNDKMDDDDI